MKRIFFVILLAVFITSCAELNSLKATATPQPTTTYIPTLPPTITPTITLTPTETPDPNMPSDATGRDPMTGNYTKSVEENGETSSFIWRQFQFGEDDQNGIAGHWFESWTTNGAINLTEYEGDCEPAWGGSFALNINVYAVEGQTFLDDLNYIYHPDRSTEWDKYKDVYGGLSCTSISLPITIMDDLFYRYLNLPQNNSHVARNRTFFDYYRDPNGEMTPEKQQQYTNDRNSFVEALNNGEMKIKVGDDEWAPNNGYEMYWVEEVMAANDPTFLVALQAYTTKSYYVKLTVEEGKLIAFVAPAGWLTDQLAGSNTDRRDATFKLIILLPLEGAINGIYPFENGGFGFSHYQGRAGLVWGKMGEYSYTIEIPFIDFINENE